MTTKPLPLRGAVPSADPRPGHYSVDALRVRIQLAVAVTALELIAESGLIDPADRLTVATRAMAWIRDLEPTP